MKRDVLAILREAMLDSFRKSAARPEDAEWMSRQAVEVVRLTLPGVRIPAISRSSVAERDTRVMELINQGISISAICARLGVVPSTVYRARDRERQRRKVATAA